MHFKRGQVGETATWIVATIAILIITFVFIYASSFISAGKKLDTDFGAGAGEGKGVLSVQQMLFAVLNYKEFEGADPVKENIISGKYNPVIQSLGPRLMEFSDSGVECGFFIIENGAIKRDLRTSDESKLGAVSVLLDEEKKVRLEC